MKRIPLRKCIENSFIAYWHGEESHFEIARQLTKFIQNNYRRRKYNVHHHSQTRRRRPANNRSIR